MVCRLSYSNIAHERWWLWICLMVMVILPKSTVVIMRSALRFEFSSLVCFSLRQFVDFSFHHSNSTGTLWGIVWSPGDRWRGRTRSWTTIVRARIIRRGRIDSWNRRAIGAVDLSETSTRRWIVVVCRCGSRLGVNAKIAPSTTPFIVWSPEI